MVRVKQILLVDDHFETLQQIRTLLESANADYRVTIVPSGEEGLLELQAMPFDLLITDARLPGMSGYDLVRRARVRLPHMPTIMIASDAGSRGEQDVAEMGVLHYFPKPLDTDSLLSAVYECLYTPEAAAEAVTAKPVASSLNDDVRRRLQSLRVDTNAAGLVLATAAGRVLYTLGSFPEMDLDVVLGIVARNLETSLALDEHLRGSDFLTIQYYTADAVELYSANVGRDYVVTMLFDAQARRGRIGTIWIFVRRAIDDLLALLPEGAEAALPGAAVMDPGEEDVVPAPEAAPARVEAAANDPAESTLAAEEAAEATGVEPDPIEIDEAAHSELLALNFEGSGDETQLEAFWDEAITSLDEDERSATDGISFDEALRQGLISDDLTPDDG